MTTTQFQPKRRADRDVTTFTEFTGLRNDTTPERFTQNDLAVADNVVLDNVRSMRRRAGSTLAAAGSKHSAWSNGQDAFVGVGTSLARVDAALGVTVLQTGLAGTPISYARGGDRIYFSDGTHTGAIEGNTVRSWGLETPSLLATKSNSDLTPGQYLATATYMRADGQESGAAGAQVITINPGDGVMLTVPPSIDPGVTSVRFYMSTVNEEVLYELATVPSSAASFSPMQADIDALNEPLVTQFMGPAPAGQLVAYYKGRMFVAVGDTLYPSQPYAYELFDARDYIVLDGPITMLAPFEDDGASGFFIATTNSTGVLIGDAPEDFKYVPKADYGVVAGALAYVDGALYTDGALGARRLPMWLSRAGICLGTPGLDIINITRERYTFDTADTGAAMYDPVTNQWVATTGANTAIAMNTQTLTLTTFSSFAYNGFMRAFERNLATSSAGLFELVGNTDAGALIQATVQFATTDFGSSFVKTIERLYAGYRSTSDMALTVTADGETPNDYFLPAVVSEVLATSRVKVGKGLTGRYWTFALANINGADFALDTLDVKSNRLERRINGRA